MLRQFAALILFALLALPASAQDAPAGPPVVVELFTSQGCEACPRANRLMGRLRAEENVLALTFPVDLWDYLGWRDTFALPEFTRRQRNYARAIDGASLFTPQFVFNGALTTASVRPDSLRGLIEEARALYAAPPEILVRRTARGMRVMVGSGPARDEPADIWVASYDPGPVWADIGGGENAGLRVPHYNLVRRLSKLGEWSGAPVSFDRPLCRPACAVLVQAAHGGPILAASQGPAAEDES